LKEVRRKDERKKGETREREIVKDRDNRKSTYLGNRNY
jgi:hypothetical protein